MGCTHSKVGPQISVNTFEEKHIGMSALDVDVAAVADLADCPVRVHSGVMPSPATSIQVTLYLTRDK